MAVSQQQQQQQQQDTVLAWLQNELQIYINLHFIPAVYHLDRTLLQKPLLCLAHRFFPDAFDTNTFDQQSPTLAISLFKDRWNIEPDQEILYYFLAIQTHVHCNSSSTETIQPFAILQDLTNLYNDSGVPNDSLDSALSHIEQQPGWYEYEQARHQHPLPLPTATQISAVQATHQAILLLLSNQHHTPPDHTAEFIRNELGFIRAKMLNTTTTEAGIRDLEDRCKTIEQLITHVPLETDMLDDYERIKVWVNDVRVWFLEAERIRAWIEQRIQQLEETAPLTFNNNDNCCCYQLEQLEEWNESHQALEQEVALFDDQDMARLRSHVKQLTSGESDLSPADTTTIEITFTTLMTLDRLMHLLRRRRYDLQIVTLRLRWESICQESCNWIKTMVDQIDLFTRQSARWRPSLSSSNNSSDDVISSLVKFEHQLVSFEQDQYAKTVQMYQDLDDASHVELPSALENAQVAFEESFERLRRHVALARQVVEQFLTITDFMERTNELTQEGHVLCEEMRENEPTADIDAWTKKVTSFQERVKRVVATLIPYPTDDEDKEEAIRKAVEDRRAGLVALTEDVQTNFRELQISLDKTKRAKQAEYEMTRLESWLEERLKRMMDSADLDVFSDTKLVLDEHDLTRLKRERDGQMMKLKGVREHEFKRVRKLVEELKDDRPRLVDLLERLTERLARLEKALAVHEDRLAILDRRITWEARHAMASLWISDTTSQVWNFIYQKAQWRKTTAAVPLDASIEDEFKSFQRKIDEFYVGEVKLVDKLFHELVHSFESSSLLDKSTNIPEHVQRRQDTLTQSFQNLCHLIQFTEAILYQHHALTQFVSQANTLQRNGNSILSHIQQQNPMTITDTDKDLLRTTVTEFDQDILRLWTQQGSQLPYPNCPEDARSTRPSTQDDTISSHIAAVIDTLYNELQTLSKRLTFELETLGRHLAYRLQTEQWAQASTRLSCRIQSQIEHIALYRFNFSTATVFHSDVKVEIETCMMEQQALFNEYTEQAREHLDQWEALRTVDDDCIDLVSMTKTDKDQLERDLAALREVQEKFDNRTSKAYQLRQQHEWEESVIAQLEACKRLISRIESYIESNVRWSSDEMNVFQVMDLYASLDDQSNKLNGLRFYPTAGSTDERLTTTQTDLVRTGTTLNEAIAQRMVMNIVLKKIDDATVAGEQAKARLLSISDNDDDNNMDVILHQYKDCVDNVQSYIRQSMIYPDILRTDHNTALQSLLSERQSTLTALEQTLVTIVAATQSKRQQRQELIRCQQLVDVWCQHAQAEHQAILNEKGNQLNHDYNLERSYREIMRVFTNRENSYQASLIHLKTVVQPVLEAFAENYNDDSTCVLQHQLTEYLEQWQSAFAEANAIHEVMRSILSHDKSAEHIRTWLDNCQSAISELQSKDDDTAWEVAGLVQKLDDFEKIILSFRSMSDELADKSEDWIDAIVKPTTVIVEDQWRSVCEALQRLEKATQGLALARKMKQIRVCVDETREDMDSVQLLSPDDSVERFLAMPRRPEIEAIQEHLKAIQTDIMPRIDQQMKDLDSAIVPDTDKLGQPYNELKQAVTDLESILLDKLASVKNCLEIGSYLTEVDSIDILQSSLEEAIQQALPRQPSPAIHSRADLQAKLIELDARYKYYDQRITHHLQQAEQQAQNAQHLTVDTHLAEMQAKWTRIKKYYKTRRIELSRIHTATLDDFIHKDHPQQRLRKSSLPTRKAASLLMRPPDMSTSSHVVGRAPPPPLAHNPRLPSSSSNSFRVSRSSNYNNNHHPKRQNMYVADPDNVLDMEIGRIVNETPYHVKVKMVPGEVGRYWFGNVNPKLCYCRVLKSKMVMVRVGGGWTELSQFLRDHALLEGDFIPKKKNKQNGTITEEEQQPKSPTFQEGFIETQRAPGRVFPTNQPSSSTSSIATSASNGSHQQAGYKEGDKFFAVDSMGNQLEVQMRKVPNNYMMQSNSSSTSTPNHTHSTNRKRVMLTRKKSEH
ncbi:MAG: hypothetical protein EXX96DRAFT_555357 [Benjaminiella poitrasii]|nr:MAG: hypothetical protein EXX96DRAFT_555357 [Benjaminiella poitrasii]